MKLLTILGEIIPVLGTVSLLGLWFFQQTEIENRVGDLQKISSARAVYQTYQSHNALFNAINELTVKETSASEQIRLYQVYNYELGLAAIEQVLPSSDKRGIPKTTSAYDSSISVQVKMSRMYERFEKLKDKFSEREKDVSNAASRAKKTYLLIYLGISLFTIMGAICKLIDKFWSKT